MTRHKQITTCRKSGGPVSKHCSCEHCCLAVCEVCGGAEGSLTTDCPGTKVTYERHQEVFETNLDYTYERGWHLAQADDGTPIRRSPRFEDTQVSHEPPRHDPREIVAPSINWAAIDHITDLKHELSLKAIAWVLADRACEERSAALARIQDETDRLRGKAELDESERGLLGALEQEKILFHIACRKVERCYDEHKQLAHRLVDVLEQQRPA